MFYVPSYIHSAYTSSMPLHVAKETEQELEAKVRSGAFPSVDRVIREGLALIEAREAFRQAVREGDAQLARGEKITGRNHADA